jgi:hypothetical protein
MHIRYCAAACQTDLYPAGTSQDEVLSYKENVRLIEAAKQELDRRQRKAKAVLTSL